MSSRVTLLAIVWLLLGGICLPDTSAAVEIQRLIVDVRTRDRAFAGTDDPVHLQIGGFDFNLDDPDRDDRERGNTDRYELDTGDRPLTFELIRGIGQISVTKLEDSFFGGGWGFGGLTIWVGDTSSAPIFDNQSINVSLDGDDLEWTSTLDEPGWNVPEPPPFPPCTTFPDVDTGEGGDPDADCDGIPDEDDDTFDEPADSDGDGLPDPYETQTGSDPDNPDSDGDGWTDGGNRRSYLVLMRIQCDDEREDIGSDEIYLTAEDVRYPWASDLRGKWAMNDGTVRSPGVVVDSRVAPLGASPTYRTRMRLRESDFRFLERPTDDTYATFTVDWRDEGTSTFTHDDSDSHYILTFRWFTVDFLDPTPLSNSDDDDDFFNEMTEFLLSVQDPSVQPERAEGFDGLSDPERRELWVEIDHSGNDQRLRFDSKQMVASRFIYEGIAPRFDDGYLNGGERLDYQETWTPTTVDSARLLEFSPERQALQHFRYAFLVDDLENGAGEFGHASFTCGLCRLIIAGVPLLGHTLTAEAQPIFFMHELGHTLGLCHRVGDRGQTVSPCPTPAGFDQTCDHYCDVGQDSNTAMGSETTLDLVTSLTGPTLAGVGGGVVAGALIGSAIAPGVGTIVGAVVGGIVGGIVGAATGAVTLADFYAREVDYDDTEWENLEL